MRPRFNSARGRTDLRWRGCTLLVLVGASLAVLRAPAQTQRPPMSDQEKAVSDEMHGMRDMPDDVRCKTVLKAAMDIRNLPPSANKVGLATGLASSATEVDCGRDNLQEVATTLSEGLREQPQPDFRGGPGYAYVELAQLVRYEGLKATLDAAPFKAALAKLEEEDKERASVDFTLQDLNGQSWTLKQLKGKVVVVNFWATWCPPCRKEMPDMQEMYTQYRDKGLVILGISDEKPEKVKPFVAEKNYTYTMLLDPGRKVNEEFHVQGIPRTFFYDREGKLVAQAIDARSRRQFMALLGAAGLQ